MTANIKAGDVIVNKLELKHSGGTVSLIGMANKVEFYESIKMPFIQGYMMVFDDRALLDKVMLADSDVEFEFTTHDSGDPVNIKFKIVDITSAIASDSGKYKTYTISMVSEELLKGTGTIITQIFEDKDVDKIIQTLIEENLSTEKKLTVEKTKAPDTVSITKLNVFQAIDKVRRRAISRNNKSSSYCFFENRHGYFFTTIENIISEAKKDPILKDGELNFFYDTDRKTIDTTDWRNIISLQQIQVQNLLDAISSGGIKNNVWAFNLETGEWKKIEYNKDEDSDEYDTGSESFQIPQSSSKYAKTEAFNHLIPISDDKEMERVEKHAFLNGYVQKLLSNIMNIYIHGDSIITAGTVINIEFPEMSGSSELEKNRLISGNYLISKIRHTILITAKPSYYQACEVLRTGFYED